MEKMISAAAARRNFSEILRAVEEGNRYVIMKRGSPVARIGPVPPAGGGHLKDALIERLRSRPTKKIGKWKTDELYP
ncbi:MAG TPA: type II toxin-antitoxin system prevent-host-death family antitoxin [Candidatus Sulfotelmatobacter sp.]|nr:type II toxin-antitoxin system prevent-host-death family antitoxin [Candidatus Sulfotelmatobacter sp.]